MAVYVPNTSAEQQAMLQECGFTDVRDMYRDVPDSVYLTGLLDLPEGAPELVVRRKVEAMAAQNHVFPHIFRGAGAYNHYIPSIVHTITDREEFKTAYTPYQAEISQGVLQSIFEYQTDICELTGMAASNASVYDGAVAAAEACEMCHDRKHSRILVSGAVDPNTLSVVRSYSFGRNVEVAEVPLKDGVTDAEALKEMVTKDTACLLVQQPNYFGILEEIEPLEQLVHANGSKLIMSCNPMTLAVLKTPGAYGADVAVGEAQPLGLPLAFGGPYIGYMAATAKMMRSLPGRIVGQTVDHEGNRAFVLTLQAREQHIRREKASSNICSNEALCAMQTAVYMAAVGPEGLKTVAEQCAAKAHYLQEQLASAGLPLAYDRPFFHEFVTEVPDAERVLKALEAHDILGGLPLDQHHLLWCATEMNTKEEMDEVIRIIKESRVEA
ncbi:MAG: aminomethyl-transferring glycine dehydrogenase subunit GcvPA [Clostridiales bacterium]|nr:aminomethyl-transferring glycine dehydrogenase subunit GcvPA [Clostridiales bacterium]